MTNKINPGEKLYLWVLNRYRRQRVNSDSWIYTVAREFEVDELEDFLLKSTSLMLLRRLICNANWYEKRYGDTTIATEKFERNYLLGTFGFRPIDRKVLKSLIFNSLETSKKNISSSLYNKLKERAYNLRQGCEICGCIIDYSSKTIFNAFTLDHIWPHSLGGVSYEWNLRIACKNCNENRQSIVEACDTHYEHFQVKSDWSPDKENSFWKELNWSFRIATLINADFKCEMCDTPVAKMEGGLDFIKRNRDENYHMFNIKIVCGKHRK